MLLLLQPGRLLLTGSRISASASISSTRTMILNKSTSRGISILCGRGPAKKQCVSAAALRSCELQRRFTASKSQSQPPTPSSSQQPSESKPTQTPEPAQKRKKPVAAALLHEDIYNLPNFLTFTRLLAAPVIGYYILHDANVWAVGLLAYAGVTDLLDGWIARRWDRKTVVGTVIDPMADKTLMTVLTVCLAAKGALPIWVAGIILGRDVGLAIAAIYYRWISLPPPKTFARYWDFSLPSAEVHPTTISKYNTLFQLALVGVTTAAPLIPADLTGALTIMQYVVAATTVWSGASYVYSKDAVKILNAPKNAKKPE